MGKTEGKRMGQKGKKIQVQIEKEGEKEKKTVKEGEKKNEWEKRDILIK